MAEKNLTIKLTVKQKRAIADLKHFGNEIKGLASRALTLGGAIGGIGFGALAGKALMTAARTEELGIILDVVRQNAGLAKEPVDELVESVKGLGITTQVSRSLVADMISTELDLAKATQLANVARNAATFSSENTSQALQGLLHGVLTLQPEVLRMRHVFVNLENEYKRFADQTNRTVESLSMHEKQQIALNAVIEAGKNIEGAYEGAMKNVRKQIGSLSRYFEEMFNQLGEIGLPALEEGVKLVKDMAEGIKQWAAENKELLKQDVARYAADLADILRTLGGWLKEHHSDLLLWSKIIISTAIIAKLGSLASVIWRVVAAIKAAGWAAAGAAGPIGIAVAVISAVTAGIIYQRHKAAEHEREMGRLGLRYKELASKAELTIEEQQELNTVTEQLNAILPAHAEKLEAVAGAYHRVAGGIRMVLSAGEAALLEKIKKVEDQIESLKSHPMMLMPGLRTPMITNIKLLEEELAALNAQYDELAASRHYYPGEIYGPPRELMKQPPPAPDLAAAKKAWQSALDELHKFRIQRLGSQAEKETQRTLEAYAKMAEEIRKIEGLSAADREAILWMLGEDQMVALKAIQDKQLEAETKAAREKAEADAEAIMEELEYKKHLYAWDTDNLIAELRKRIAAEAEAAGVRGVLEEKLAELQKDRAVEVADATREALDKQREAGVRLWQDVGQAAKSTLTQLISDTREAQQAWEDFGSYLKRRFVDFALTEVLNMLRNIGRESDFVGPSAPRSGGFWDIAKTIFSWLPFTGAQHGLYVPRPTLVLAGEGGQEEVISPVPMMRRIVREELAAAGGGGPSVVIENINAIDAPSFEHWFRHGRGGEVFTRGVKRGWIKIPEK